MIFLFQDTTGPYWWLSTQVVSTRVTERDDPVTDASIVTSYFCEWIRPGLSDPDHTGIHIQVFTQWLGPDAAPVWKDDFVISLKRAAHDVAGCQHKAVLTYDDSTTKTLAIGNTNDGWYRE